jgi:hypothetical protein
MGYCYGRHELVKLTGFNNELLRQLVCLNCGRSAKDLGLTRLTALDHKPIEGERNAEIDAEMAENAELEDDTTNARPETQGAGSVAINSGYCDNCGLRFFSAGNWPLRPFLCSTCEDEGAEIKPPADDLTNARPETQGAAVCDWCTRTTARRFDLTMNGELVCGSCKPYAWAALVNGDKYRPDNLRIARVKADRDDMTNGRPQTQPDIEQLTEWVNDGIAEATDGCRVEPDGTCEHGAESWLLAMGLI